MRKAFIALFLGVVCCLLLSASDTGSLYGNVNKKGSIEITSPDGEGFPVTMSGAVPVVVNIYHPASQAKEVKYSCLVDGKRLINNKKLTRKSDWTWSDMLYLTNRPYGKSIIIRVTATYKNGEKMEKERRFTYNNRKPLINLDKEWINLRGDAQHTGISEVSLTTPLKMTWINNIGAHIFLTSPIIHQHKVFVASVDEERKGKGAVYALDSQTGNLLWKYPVNNAIRNSIVAENGIVYVQTEQGSLFAIKASDGSLCWGRQLHVNEESPLIEGLVVSNGVVYAGSGLALCALDAKSGDVIWQNSGWNQGDATAATPVVADGMLVSFSQSQGLYGNDMLTGEFKWHTDRAELIHRGSSPALYHGLLYLLSGQSLFVIQPETGRIVVRKEYPFSLKTSSTPLMTDKLIVFGSATEGLIGIDRETLEVVWKVPTGQALTPITSPLREALADIESSPVLSGGIIYFGASDGCLYGINKDNGEVVWKHVAGAPILGSVAISGNALFAVDFGGNVYAFTTAP